MHILYFIDVIINGMKVKGLIDMGALHNFLWTKLSMKLGIKVDKGSSSMNVMNYRLKEIT